MRAYHSPSSIDLGRRCEYAWALCYIAKLREPDVDYRDIESKKVEATWDANPWKGGVTYKMRGASLGTGVHATFEAHFGFKTPDWSWFPGQVAQSGLHYLPAREECSPIEIEHEIGREPVEQNDPNRPSRGLKLHNGIILVGKRDLTVFHECRWLLADYKSTASIVKYAKTAEVLQDDVAANAYAYDCFIEHPDDYYGDCRWLYLESKEKRQAVPIDFKINFASAVDILLEAATFAAHLDTIVSVADAKQETRSCCDFSGRPGEIGCSYHVSKGGPCTARPGLGQLIQARTKEKARINMPTAQELKDKLAASKAARAGTAAVEAPKDPEGQDEKAVVETAAPVVTRKPATRGKPAAVPAGAAAIVAQAQKIADAEGAVELASTALVSAKQEMAALCA